MPDWIFHGSYTHTGVCTFTLLKAIVYSENDYAVTNVIPLNKSRGELDLWQ